MAYLIRNPKSGSDWTQNELDAYNIEVQKMDIFSFFGIQVLPEPECHPHFLAFERRSDNPNMDDYIDDLLWRMNQAMDSTEESFVDGFAERILNMMKFTKKGLHTATRKALPLQIGAEQKSAQTDVCIMDDQGIYLLVQEDKSRINESRERAEAQLVAEAIAAYQGNIRHTRHIDTMIIPGIIMVGTYPIFYKIPVTSTLNNCVRSLTYPNMVTIIEKLEPPINRYETRYIEGMLHLDNRNIIIRCFEAFKLYVFVPFLRIHIT